MDTCTHASLSVCVSNTQEEGGKKTPTDVNRSKSIKASAVMGLRRLWPVSSTDINQSPRSQHGAKVRPRTAPPPRAPSRCTVHVDSCPHISPAVFKAAATKVQGGNSRPSKQKMDCFMFVLTPPPSAPRVGTSHLLLTDLALRVESSADCFQRKKKIGPNLFPIKKNF